MYQSGDGQLDHAGGIWIWIYTCWEQIARQCSVTDSTSRQQGHIEPGKGFCESTPLPLCELIR